MPAGKSDVRREFLSFSDLRRRSCREQALAGVVSDHRHERAEEARGECQTRLKRFELQLVGAAATGRLAAAAGESDGLPSGGGHQEAPGRKNEEDAEMCCAARTLGLPADASRSDARLNPEIASWIASSRCHARSPRQRLTPCHSPMALSPLARRAAGDVLAEIVSDGSNYTASGTGLGATPFAIASVTGRIVVADKGSIPGQSFRVLTGTPLAKAVPITPWTSGRPSGNGRVPERELCRRLPRR